MAEASAGVDSFAPGVGSGIVGAAAAKLPRSALGRWSGVGSACEGIAATGSGRSGASEPGSFGAAAFAGVSESAFEGAAARDFPKRRGKRRVSPWPGPSSGAEPRTIRLLPWACVRPRAFRTSANRSRR